MIKLLYSLYRQEVLYAAAQGTNPVTAYLAALSLWVRLLKISYLWTVFALHPDRKLRKEWGFIMSKWLQEKVDRETLRHRAANMRRAAYVVKTKRAQQALFQAAHLMETAAESCLESTEAATLITE